MKVDNLMVRVIGLIVALLVLQACSNYDPVPAGDCGKVVEHARQVLGDFAPSYADMMKDCKAASDSERGCVMAATKKGQVAQCM